MKTVKTDLGVEIKLYSSCYDLPMSRYNELRKYVLADSGIGSDMESINSHFNTLDSLLSHEKLQEAKQQRINLHTSFYLAIEKINIKNICFAVFVYSINGNPVLKPGMQLTEEVLIDITRKLEHTGLRQGQVLDILDDLKKKLIPNWKYYFQNREAGEWGLPTIVKSRGKLSLFANRFKNHVRMFWIKFSVLKNMK